jgi:hypothetical protein
MANDWLKKLRNKQSKNNNYRQGVYQVINLKKYIGKSMPMCLSSWEFRFCYFLDMNDKVKQWGSEIIEIPYSDYVDKRNHIYVVDFFAEIEDKLGNINKYVIEIKPSKSLIPPNKPKNPTMKAMKNYLYSLNEYMKNKAKWSSAKLFCESHNMKFTVLTENQIF